MTFPSVDSALTYVKGKLTEFYGQMQVLKDRLRQIALLTEKAKQKNDQSAIGQLIILRQQTMDAMQEQLALEQRLQPFIQYFGFTPPTLQAIPVVLTLVGIGVASALYLHFEKLKNQGKALELIAKGFLTPQEAEAIISPPLFGGFGGGFSMILVLVLGGGILYVSGALKRT